MEFGNSHSVRFWGILSQGDSHNIRLLLYFNFRIKILLDHPLQQQQEADADEAEIVVEQSGSVVAMRQRSDDKDNVLFHLQEDSDGFYHDEPRKIHK